MQILRDLVAHQGFQQDSVSGVQALQVARVEDRDDVDVPGSSLSVTKLPFNHCSRIGTTRFIASRVARNESNNGRLRCEVGNRSTNEISISATVAS